jgi:predicted dehydrogenase
MKHILIVGNGSIGKRHARNLFNLGCKISVIDPREDRRTELNSQMTVENQFSSLDAALAKPTNYDGAVIATAPALHAEQGITLMKRGIPIYMEKGLALTKEDCSDLLYWEKETETPVLMGYTWRWAQSIRDLHDYMRRVGRIIRVNMVMAANLHDWHPWEPLSDFYIATRGGVENESHWIDLMLMWFGMPEAVYGEVSALARDTIPITQNDNLDLTAHYPAQNMRCHIHLDLYTRPHEKTIKIIGTDGTIDWRPNEIRIDHNKDTDLLRSGDGWNESYEYPEKRNVMFENAAKDWLAILHYYEHELLIPMPTMQDGANVIDIIEDLRQQS